MKISISYRFTGEDIEPLTKFMTNVCNSLKQAGHTTLTTFWKKDEFEQNNTSLKELMQTALDYIDESDMHLIIIKSNEKSEGLLIEAGYALAKQKKIVLAIKKNINTTWLKELSNKVIEFTDIEDLYNKLRTIR